MRSDYQIVRKRGSEIYNVVDTVPEFRNRKVNTVYNKDIIAVAGLSLKCQPRSTGLR
jgi:DNA-binding protein